MVISLYYPTRFVIDPEKIERDSTGRAVSSLENGEFPSMREAWDRMPKSRTCGKNYRFFQAGKWTYATTLQLSVFSRSAGTTIFSAL